MKLKLTSLLFIASCVAAYFLLNNEEESDKSDRAIPTIRATNAPEREVQTEQQSPANLSSDSPQGPTTQSAEATWLELRTQETLATETSEQNGYQVESRIVRADFHKPLVRADTRRDPYSESPTITTLAVANEFIARLAPDASFDELSQLAANIGAQAIPLGQNSRHARIVFPPSADLLRLPSLSKTLEAASQIVAYVEPDYLLHSSQTVPNDPRFAEQRNLSHTLDHDIDAPEAWDIAHDAGDTIIAIVDTGIRSTHQDLAPNLWTNSAEIPNGRDDDGNGIADDLHGLNAIDGNGAIEDDNGHGSHVAGIAGARGNNGLGIAGAAWTVQLMPLKFLDSTGSGTTSDAIECLQYAIDKNVDVINNSWGGSGESSALFDTLSDASAKGILIATAAGNESNQLDAQPSYPAAYQIPNQVVVVATDQLDRLDSYSNFSPLLSHIAAPGQAISAFKDSDSSYTELIGTSMATPLVAGSLALLKSQLPELKPNQIIARLLDAADLQPSLTEKTLSEGRLNLNRALLGETNSPANDHFANATPLPPEGGRVSGSTTRASREDGEPLAQTTNKGHTLWYKWTPYRDGRAQVRLAPTGFSGSITLFEGNQLENLTQIATAATSLINNYVVADLDFVHGNTYYLQVDTTSVERGPYSLQIAVAAENDSFASSTELQGDAFNIRSTNQAASTERGEAPIHPSAAGASVWFHWTAPQDGDFFLRIQQASSPMFAAIFTGDSLDELVEVESIGEEQSPSKLLFHVEAGTTYRFAVDSLLDEGTTFRVDGSYLSQPRILSQPRDLNLKLGASANLFVSVFGQGTPSFQWLKDGNELPGETQDTLTITNVSLSDFGSYQARIQISGTTLLSRAAKLSQTSLAIGFLQQPAAQSITNGSPLKLKAIVSGASEDTTYQWLRDGKAVAGQNTATLLINHATSADTGFYTLRVTRGSSSRDSKPAYVAVSSSDQFETFSWANIESNFSNGNQVDRVGDFFITYDNGIAFSPDRYNWQYSQNDGRQVAYSGGFYYSASSDGVYRSTNLTNWTRVYTTAESERVYGIAAGNGVILCHTNSAVLRSTDGLSWSNTLEVSLPSERHLQFGNGTFILAKQDIAYRSADGLNWTSTSIPGNQQTLAYGAHRWWNANQTSKGELLTSTDGETWTPFEGAPFDYAAKFIPDPVTDDIYIVGSIKHLRPGPFPFPEYQVNLYRYDGSTFQLVIQFVDSSSSLISYPPMSAYDGQVLAHLVTGVKPIEQYSNGDYPNYGGGNQWWRNAILSYANGKYLASSRSQLRSSSDGTKWVVESNSDTEFGKIVYGNGYYVGPNHHGSHLSSLKTHNKDFRQVAYGKNVFVGVDYGSIYYSTDGTSWTQAIDSTGTINAVVFGAGAFIVYYGDNIYRSTNGINWAKIQPSQGFSLDNLTFGNGRFVGFNNNQCYLSTDGLSWSKGGKLELPGHFGGWTGEVNFFDGSFFVSYTSDTYFESTDGLSWQLSPIRSSVLGFNPHPSYAAGPDALLIGSSLGIGILGTTRTSGIQTQISSLAKKVGTSAGTPVNISFDTASATSPLARTEILVDGQLWKTLGPNENSFSYLPESTGDKTIKIVSYDQVGNSAQDQLSLNVSPLVHSNRQGGEFRPYQILYHNGAFYAGADAGRIYVSGDGINWKGIQTPTLEKITSIAANDSAIVATHTGGGILYSANGIEWLLIGDFTSHSVINDGDAFVTGSRQNPIISLDGRTWFYALTGETLTGAPYTPIDQTVIFNSPDYGAFLSKPGELATEIDEMSKVYRIGDAYVGIKNGKIYYSENLQTWSDVSPSEYGQEDIEFVQGLIFYKSYTTVTHVSGNGIDWLPIEQNISTPYISYSDGYYYAITFEQGTSIQHHLIRSRNGIDWEPYGPTLSADTYAPRFKQIEASPNGVAVLSENNGITYRFVDEQDSLALITSNDASYSDKMRIIGPEGSIALTDYGTYRLSSAGDWEKSENSIPYQTAFANGLYVGAWHSGDFFSHDGKNWTEIELPEWAKALDTFIGFEQVYNEGTKAVWGQIRYSIINGNGYSETRWAYARTTDGQSWQQVPHPEGFGEISQLTDFKGRTYTYNSGFTDSTVYRLSTDYSGWESIPIPSAEQSLVATKDRMGVLNDDYNGSSKIILTTDGTNWTSHALPVSGYVKLLATDEAFYLLADQVWKSTDGINWTVHLPYKLRAASNKDRIVLFRENYVIVEPTSLDLAVSQVVVTSQEYATGDTIPIEVTLSNPGNERLDWPLDSVIDYAFTQAAGNWSVNPLQPGFKGTATIPFHTLQPGESKKFTLDATVPNKINPGSYFLAVFLGTNIVAKDGNPSNDYFTRTEATPITIPERSLTLSKSPHGTVTGIEGRDKFAWKEQVFLTAVPDFGYEFSGWSGDIPYPEETLLVTLNEDTSVQANFTPKSFNLSIDVEGEGSVEGIPASLSIRFGDELALAATPKEGWTFIGWDGYGKSASQSLSAKVGRNLAIKAHFGRLYSSWAKNKYGDDPELIALEADPSRTGSTNLERFVFGLDFPEQRDAENLGFRIEDRTLVYRYALYRGLFEFATDPVWSHDAIRWQTSNITNQKVSETADLSIYEAKLPLGSTPSTTLFSIRISNTPDSF